MELEVSILNWEKFNEKRKDVQTCTWFRMENGILMSQSLFGLDAEAVVTFIGLLSLACKQQSADLKFDSAYFCYTLGGRMSEAKLIESLKALHGKVIELRDVPVTDTGRTRAEDVTDTGRARDADGPLQTDKQTIQTIQDKQTVPAPNVAGPSPGVLVFEKYAAAYQAKFGRQPVRNKKVNSLCKQLAERLGQDAPEVAQFYLAHTVPLYVNSGFALDLLVRDAEKLHTEWATGRITKVTPFKTRSQAISDANQALYEKVERGEL